MAMEAKMGIKYEGEYGYEFHDFLRAIDIIGNYKIWLFGHYHADRVLDEKHILIYNNFVELTKEGVVDVY